MKNKKIYIETFGCQMNVYDSDRMAGLLAGINYVPADGPEHADLVIVNTCTIRQKAVQKAYSFIGRLWRLKKRRPSMIVAVTGCLAQQEGERVKERFSHVDIVLGTRRIESIVDHVRAVSAGVNRNIVDIALNDTGKGFYMKPGVIPEKAGVSRFVTIMRGCDNFCTYCVVPYVRGREESRPPQDIIEEIESLVSAGVSEVTLLGQNVNSYGKKEGLCTFPQLLERVADIEGLERIRFVTSHPKDLSDELVSAFDRIGRLCNHIHLPVQSGSDRILSRMHRRYTRADYIEKLARLRAVRPDIAVTTDIIVGFPGETDDDFSKTIDLIEQVRFDTLFAFAYSDRPMAPASGYPGKVDESTKSARLGRVFSVQRQITRDIFAAQEGRVFQVLVEGISKKEVHASTGGNSIQMTGRTSENRIVNFDLPAGMQSNSRAGNGRIPDAWIGKIVPVKITGGCANSLSGVLVAGPNSFGEEKEGKAHVA